MITKQIFVIVIVMLMLVGCKDKSDSMTNEQKIAGDGQKTWVAKRETDATGDKDKITKAEKKEVITFWSNGNVKMTDGNQSQSGQWSFNGGTLTLAFAGADVTENFTVLELDDDKMKLKAGDGSEMVMEPE
jgi:uncharacterized lipoprotein NlpE involved in copper resistance